MRTTVNLDDDVIASARALAQERKISLGQALSHLVRRGLGTSYTSSSTGLPTFPVSATAPPLTPDLVDEANEDG